MPPEENEAIREVARLRGVIAGLERVTQEAIAKAFRRPIAISIVNRSTALPDADAEDIAQALQTFVSQHVGPLWSTDATVRFIPKGGLLVPGEWQFVFLDDLNQAGIAGWHSMTSDGLPSGQMYVKQGALFGITPDLLASHEVAEALADPWGDRMVYANGRFWIVENADPLNLRAYHFGTYRDGRELRMHDFVLPRWFQPGPNSKPPFTYLQTLDQAADPDVKRPFDIGVGGLLNWFDGANWQTVYNWGSNGVTPALNAVKAAMGYHGGRRARRMAPRSAWRRSWAN